MAGWDSSWADNAEPQLSLVSELMTSAAQGKGIFGRGNSVQLWKNVHPSVAEISPPESLALKIPQQTILIVLHHVHQCASVCVQRGLSER